jgi:hypothetical protein
MVASYFNIFLKIIFNFKCFSNEAATVEALVHHIGNLKTVVSFWDEAATFFGSFGLYKANGK